MFKHLLIAFAVSAMGTLAVADIAEAGMGCGDLSRQIKKAEERQDRLTPKRGGGKRKATIDISDSKLDHDDMKELEDFYKLAFDCEKEGQLVEAGKASRAAFATYDRLKKRGSYTTWDKTKSSTWASELHFFDDIYTVWENSRNYGDIRPNQIREVQKEYSVAIAQNSKNGTAYSNRARASMHLGEYAEAEKDLRKAVSIRGNFRDYNSLADILFEQGRSDEATSFTNRAMGVEAEWDASEKHDKLYKKELAKREQEIRQAERKREQERKTEQRNYIRKNFNDQEYAALKEMIKLDEELDYYEVSYSKEEENCIGKLSLGQSVWVEYHCKDGLTRVSLPKSVSEELVAIAKFNGLRINMKMDLPFTVWLAEQTRKYEESKGELGVRFTEQEAGAIVLNMINKGLKYGKFKRIQKIMEAYSEAVKYDRD